MERCLTPSLTLAFAGQGHERDLAQEHEGKPKAERRAGVSLTEELKNELTRSEEKMEQMVQSYGIWIL